MALSFPTYEQLSDSQRTVINLPSDKNHIILGEAGTGKSVGAIYSACQMLNNGKKVLFLVFNRPLMLYIQSVIKDFGKNLELYTWQSWINSFYKLQLKKSVPQGKERFTYNWDKIIADIKKLEPFYDHVIIDEAQDIPLELIKVLLLVSRNISCYLDPSQKIGQDGTDLDEIIDALGVRSTFTLAENYRNTQGVFNFAKLYSEESKAKVFNTELNKPIMFNAANYEEQNELIAKIIVENNLKNVGVFANSQSVFSTYKSLSESLPGTNIQLYQTTGKEHRDIDFTQDAVFVIPYTCAKGLEFDSVILTRCELINSTKDEILDRNLLYVATTRPKKNLFCIYFGKNHSKGIDVFSAIDGNEDLVEWK